MCRLHHWYPCLYPHKNFNVIYNLNIGYDKKVNSKFLKNTIFDFGYYYKRLETESEDEYKWTTFSIIFDPGWTPRSQVVCR